VATSVPLALRERIAQLYDAYGQRKPMGIGAVAPDRPHYFLHRTFLSEQDLLIIFNTKRCRYQCYFCQLPAKSSKMRIPADQIVAQFEYVVTELKHSLSVIERLTFSNEGSVLDASTFPTEALLTIAQSINELRRVETLVLETRLEFVDPQVLQRVRAITPRVTTRILTGFETHDPRLRDEVLFKREPLGTFERGLERVAESGSALTAYVLFKPAQTMSDAEAVIEAEASIEYLDEQCRRRGIPLDIRLNPMYAAAGSKWATRARQSPAYQPPQLTDVMRVAQRKRRGDLPIYIGLSTEGLDDGSSYLVREDYSPRLIKLIKLFNDGKLLSFDGAL
jgi:radical SAM enzyme (TIGR01210 family)